MSKSDKTPEPMDASASEQKTGTAASNTPRACYAIKTLIKEVNDLFPETTHTVGNYSGRNVGLSVAFDLSELDDEDQIAVTDLFKILDSDIRVAGIVTDTENSVVTISMKPSARTQDSRDSFGLGVAWEILTEGEPEVFGGTEFNWGTSYPSWDATTNAAFDLSMADGSS